MTLPLLTFAGVVALIVGVYWLLVLRPEEQEGSAVKKRLRPATVRALARTSVSQDTRKLSAIPTLDALLARSQGLGGRVQTLVDRSGLQITVGALLLMSGCFALAVYLLLAFAGVLKVAAVMFAALAASGPFFFVNYKADKRIARFEELFPEAISLIIRSLRAGHAFTTGLAMVAEEMDDPVNGEFRTLYDQQNFGMPLEEALKDLARRQPLLDVKFFVTAVLTQREAGGNLAEVLENLAAVVRDRFKVKRQVRVVTAHARISGLILMIMPVACALIELVIAPQQMRILWTDPIGVRMIIGGIFLQVTGVLIIRRLIRIEY